MITIDLCFPDLSLFGKTKFDIINCSQVITHMNYNPITFFKGVHKLLKKNGRFYLTTFNGKHFTNERIPTVDCMPIKKSDPVVPKNEQFNKKYYGATHFFYREELEKLFDEAGFKIEKELQKDDKFFNFVLIKK